MALCAAVRAEGLSVTPARVMDTLRSVTAVDWSSLDDYRLAVRTNLVGSLDDEIRFDRVFAQFWYGRAEEDGMRLMFSRAEYVRGDLEHGLSRDAHRDMLTEPENFGAEEVTRFLNLERRWDDDAPPLEAIIQALAKKLATRESRRSKPAKHGRQIDMQRAFRKSLRHGMEFLEMPRRQKKMRKTRIVLLCDVSGSMDVFNAFLLNLMLGVQRVLTNSRTLVFSTRVSEITGLLRRRSVDETLREVSENVKHWSGGTDLGIAFRTVNCGVLQEGTPGSTVLIVISDGYDNGSIETIKRELTSAKRRIRKLVWINPMYGASSFQVRAQGMKAAMPFIDHFLPAFDAKALRQMIRELAEI
ncbi:MAG: VWA domain-containing protein [Pseudomonadota bacterium]